MESFMLTDVLMFSGFCSVGNPILLEWIGSGGARSKNESYNRNFRIIGDHLIFSKKTSTLEIPPGADLATGRLPRKCVVTLHELFTFTVPLLYPSHPVNHYTGPRLLNIPA